MDVSGIEAQPDGGADVEDDAPEGVAAAGLDLRVAELDVVVGLFAEERALKYASRACFARVRGGEVYHFRPHDETHSRPDRPPCRQRQPLAFDLDLACREDTPVEKIGAADEPRDELCLRPVV